MAEQANPEESREIPEDRNPGADDEEVSLLDMLVVLAKHKRIVLGFPLVAALGAAVVSMLLPKWYESTARILPPQQQSTASAMLGQLGALASIAGAGLGLKNPSDMYVGLLRSRTVADALIQRFDLMQIYNNKYVMDTRRDLERNTTIKAGKDGIITIDFEDKDPKRAAEIANAYVAELNKLTQTVAVTEAAQRRVFFERQLVTEKDLLANAEVDLKKTQESTGLIRLDDQSRAIIQNVARLRGLVSSKEVQLASMRSFATETNPELMRVQQEIAGLRAQLAQVEKQQESQQDGIFVPTGKVPTVGLEYIRKFREVKYHETLFELLAKQFELAKIDEAREGSIVQIVDRAVEPDRRARPRRTLIVLVTAVVAGFIAIAWAFVRENMDRAAADPQKAERLRAIRRYLAWRR